MIVHGLSMFASALYILIPLFLSCDTLTRKFFSPEMGKMFENFVSKSNDDNEFKSSVYGGYGNFGDIGGGLSKNSDDLEETIANAKLLCNGIKICE